MNDITDTLEFNMLAKIICMMWKLFYPQWALLSTREKIKAGYSYDEHGWESSYDEIVAYMEAYAKSKTFISDDTSDVI